MPALKPATIGQNLLTAFGQNRPLTTVEHNYAFYRIENDTVYVTDIYNEREDFMWEMFRVNFRCVRGDILDVRD